MIDVLYFGGIFPSVVAPAFSCGVSVLVQDTQPASPYANRRLWAHPFSCCAKKRKKKQKKKPSKVKRHLVSKERRSKQHRPSAKERMLTSPSSSNSRLRWGSFGTQKDSDDWSSRLLTIKQLKGHVQNYRRLWRSPKNVAACTLAKDGDC